MSGPAQGVGRRIVGVDLARALALFGMYVAHLLSSRDPDDPGGVDAVFQVVAGRSSALFAVLAGVGIALSTRSAMRGDRTPAGRLAVRAVLVALMGLGLGMVDSGLAVILTYYGLLFLCAIPVLSWRARSLAWLALGWGLLSPVVSMVLRRGLDPRPKMVPSFESLTDPLGLASELLLTGYYPVLTWATYIFAGMAIGRLDLRHHAAAYRLTRVGAWLTALTIVLSYTLTRSAGVRAALLADPPRPVSDWAGLDTLLRLGLYGTHPPGSAWWLAVWSPHSGSIMDLAHTVGSSMFVLGLSLWLVQHVRALPWHLLAGAGTMTLTLYSVHVLVLATPLEQEGWPALAAHVGASLVIGTLVARAGLRGPLEQLVTTLSRKVVPGAP